MVADLLPPSLTQKALKASVRGSWRYLGASVLTQQWGDGSIWPTPPKSRDTALAPTWLDLCDGGSVSGSDLRDDRTVPCSAAPRASRGSRSAAVTRCVALPKLDWLAVPQHTVVAQAS